MHPTIKVLAICFAIMFLSLSVAAAGDLPEIKFEKYTLPNGLDVILHEDHSIPMVAVNIWYHVGSKNEEAGRTGFAHLFEHLMFQGSEHTPGEYFTPLQEVGGQVNGSTTEDRTNYWENVPSNYLELALWMESDRLGFLPDAMTQEKLDNQRDVVMNERRQNVDNQPYGHAGELIHHMMYPSNHPYSWPVIGSMRDLAAASIEDVTEFFHKYYTPNNASLCIAGDFDPAVAKQLVEKYFANLPPGPPIERMTGWVPELDGVKREVAEDDVELARLDYVWHTPAFYAPGDAEFDLFANILSTGKTSRLYKALVYEQQIAQNVVAYQSSRELCSTFHIQVTAQKGHSLDEIEKAVDAELQKILTEGISEEELQQAKTTWEASFVRQLESIGGFSGRANILNAYNTMLGDPGMLAWDMERYTKATSESVMSYVKKYIDFNKRAILHIVPQGTLTASDVVIDRDTKPSPMPEPTFDPPAIQTATLSNGLEILLVEDHKLPLVEMDLVLKSGWAADPPGKFGTAALTAEMLNEGTKNRSALEIAEDAKRIAAHLGTGSSFDGSTVSLNVLKKNLDPALDLMADVILNPVFPRDELERQRQIYLGRIQQESKQPFPSAFKLYMKEVFGSKHPYSQPYTGSGTKESIKAMNRDDLVEFYKTHYFPNNAAIAIAGDITLAEAKEKIEKAFKDWKQGVVATQNVTDPKVPDHPVIYLVDKPGAEQSMIVTGNLAMSRNNPDYLNFKVMNQALGGQFVSRVNLNLREDKGYTYGAGSFLWTTLNTGPFVCYAPVHTQFTKESLVEIIRELRGITGDRPLTTEELDFAKSSLVKGFPQRFQTLGAITRALGSIVLYDLPLDDWSTYIDRVKNVSVETASRVASEYIHPESLVIVIVGDKSKIEDGIRELNQEKAEDGSSGLGLKNVEIIDQVNETI